MSLIDDSVKEQVKKTLSKMESEVDVLFFESEGQFTNEIKQLLNELEMLSSKLNVSYHKVGDDVSKKYNVEEGPVMKIMSKHIKGDARIYGIPSGSEFGVLLYLFEIASNGKITGPLVEVSNKIKEDYKLEVFVSPNCPHCPSSALVALKLAILNPKIKGYVYEVMEFQEKVHKYNVSGVPKTIINEGKFEYMGGLPEDMASKEILKTI